MFCNITVCLYSCIIRVKQSQSNDGGQIPGESTEMRIFVWFRRLIITFAAVCTMLFFLQRQNSTRMLPTWSAFDTHESTITHMQLENYWRIPGGRSSLLPHIISSIDLYTDINKLREQVIQQKEECRHLKEDPFSMFKSQPSETTQFTAEKDISRIKLAFMCGGALHPEFLTAIPREELYPFEAFYLSDPPLWNNSTVACHSHSTISLYGAGVVATLRQPREFFRALAYVHRTLKSTIPFFGAYINAKASESVPCSPFPLVPGYRKSELCNLTSGNGFPWYCGYPRKQELNCSDYHLHRFSRNHIVMPVTPVEDKLLRQPINQSNFLTGDIILNVKATKSGITRLQDSNVPCNKVSTRATWHQPVPPGYFYHKVWKSFLCFTPDQPEKVDESCLKNTHMIIYGDSNGRYFYYRVQSKVKCKETVYSINGLDQHARKICENKTRNFSIEYMSHGSPFHSGVDVFINTIYLHSPEKVLASIPSQGRYIIVFNHYLHFTAHHFSVYERALIAVRDAILRLLKRNPHVLIMLRGPHVSERDPYTYFVGDVWGKYITTIQKETFKNLQDHVIYFPTWDITVASEDRTPHPGCNDHMSDVMLHYLCGRNQ